MKRKRKSLYGYARSAWQKDMFYRRKDIKFVTWNLNMPFIRKKKLPRFLETKVRITIEEVT